MRCARIYFQRGILDYLGGKQGRGPDRHDLVVVAVEYERWHVELFEVFGEIGFGEGFDAVYDGFETDLHPLQPERVAQALRDLGAWPVGSVEWRGEILEELRSVREDVGADAVEDLDRQTAGVGGCFQHQRWHRADQHGLGYTFRPVAPDIAGYFAAPGGVANMNRVLQVECFDERREIVGVRVHLVAIPGLARSAMPPAVMGDAPVSVSGQEHHLVFPCVRVQRPAMAEDYGLSAAPVFVIDLRAVFGCDHLMSIAPITGKSSPCSLNDLRHNSEQASSRGRVPNN